MQKNKNPLRTFLIFVFILFFLAGVGYTVFNESGLLVYIEIYQRSISLEEEINSLEKRIFQLNKEIDSLQTDIFKIEKVAREKYNMLQKNEKALRIEIE